MFPQGKNGKQINPFNNSSNSQVSTTIGIIQKETFIQPINEQINTSQPYDVSPFLSSLKTAFDFAPIFEMKTLNIKVVPASTILFHNINKNNLEENLLEKDCKLDSPSEPSIYFQDNIDDNDNSSIDDSDSHYKEELLSPGFCSSNCI